MITLRIDKNLERTITITAENLGLTKSELIRKSILAFIDTLDPPNAWDVGQDLFGKYASGIDSLSSNRKALLKKKIRAKRDEKNSH